jgi:hypothetical protein
MINPRWALAAMIATTVLPDVALGQMRPDEPIKTTLCELVKTPERFNTKIVEFRAEFTSRFQWAGFVDESCSAKIPVGVCHAFDNLKPAQGEYAFTTASDDNTYPEKLKWKPIEPLRPVQLKTDDNYRTFRHYADTKFKWPDGGECQDCPLYRTIVTAIGRFDCFQTQTVSVRANPATKAFHYSAGDSDGPLLRFVLVSVEDVSSTSVNPSVYSELKRRDVTLEEVDALVTAFFKDRGSTKAPGFELVNYPVEDSPGFQFLQAIWNNPKGSVNLGHYAVDRKTGDIWNAVICEHVISPSLVKLQNAIRNRIGLTRDEYRKARRPGPMCEPENPRVMRGK